MADELPHVLQKYKKYIDLTLFKNDDLDPTTPDANAKTLHTYIAQRLAWYAEIEYTAGRLWELYKEDFKSWTVEMMDKCKADMLYLLRDFLVKNGVFIPRDNRRLAIRLIDVVNEIEDHEWTQEEIEIQMRRGGGFSSSYIPPTSYQASNYKTNINSESKVFSSQKVDVTCSGQLTTQSQRQPNEKQSSQFQHLTTKEQD
ncbi:putative powdery mildew-specific protein [Golovinomyces cichoracearum]|uniref:Putative powdery mildew-specific protein n=1 Tax=Golovinomyces cichoracearum TaxID=62708 RepID=A0A420JB93_9PEZI|nr:putative powdery mildew-specific protein [Golovinomyces cichoracearum]